MEAIMEFASASTAAPVYVMLGFVPDQVELWSDIGGTPKCITWFNNAKYASWPVTDTTIQSGSTFTKDANTLISVYAGGDVVAAAETANTSGKHVNRAGVASPAGLTTSQGILIAAGAQANSGRNYLVARRQDS